MAKSATKRAGRELPDEEERLMPFNWNKSNPFLGRDGEPIPGVCAVCGCEHDNPCEVGCSWVNVEQTLCSACAEMLGIRSGPGGPRS